MPSPRQRSFLLGDEELAVCGNCGPGSSGIAYFCPSCGRVWGRVSLGWDEWFAAKHSCEHCPQSGQHIPGSFLRPLCWWDDLNGNTIEKQLASFSPTILKHEAKVHANWYLQWKHRQSVLVTTPALR